MLGALFNGCISVFSLFLKKNPNSEEEKIHFWYSCYFVVHFPQKFIRKLLLCSWILAFANTKTKKIFNPFTFSLFLFVTCFVSVKCIEYWLIYIWLCISNFFSIFRWIFWGKKQQNRFVSSSSSSQLSLREGCSIFYVSLLLQRMHASSAHKFTEQLNISSSSSTPYHHHYISKSSGLGPQRFFYNNNYYCRNFYVNGQSSRQKPKNGNDEQKMGKTAYRKNWKSLCLLAVEWMTMRWFISVSICVGGFFLLYLLLSCSYQFYVRYKYKIPNQRYGARNIWLKSELCVWVNVVITYYP